MIGWWVPGDQADAARRARHQNCLHEESSRSAIWPCSIALSIKIGV
jgi:hypothetical protein